MYTSESYVLYHWHVFTSVQCSLAFRHTLSGAHTRSVVAVGALLS